MDEVVKQNKEYFEAKARDYLEKRKHDAVSLASANLLFKSLNMNMEAYLQKQSKSKKQSDQLGNESKSKSSVHQSKNLNENSKTENKKKDQNLLKEQ